MNEWNLKPRSKSGFYGSNAKNNIREMSNYHPNKTKEQLEEEIITGNDEIDAVLDKFEDIDYGNAFETSLKFSEKKRVALFESVFKRWTKLSEDELIEAVGEIALARILYFVSLVYPDDYENRVLAEWPTIGEKTVLKYPVGEEPIDKNA